MNFMPWKKKDIKNVDIDSTEENTEVRETKADEAADIHDGSNGKDGQKKNKKEFSLALYILKFFLKLVTIVVVTWGLLHFVFGLFILRGNYMFPAVRDGDLCFTYRLEDYVIGDVVLYNHDGKERVGRVIATAGMDVEVNETGELLVEGMVPAEQIFYLTEAGTQKYPYTVKEGEVFIMNDFRSDVEDSRTYGSIKKTDLDGKCIFVIRRRGF